MEYIGVVYGRSGKLEIHNMNKLVVSLVWMKREGERERGREKGEIPKILGYFKRRITKASMFCLFPLPLLRRRLLPFCLSLMCT